MLLKQLNPIMAIMTSRSPVRIPARRSGGRGKLEKQWDEQLAQSSLVPR